MRLSFCDLCGCPIKNVSYFILIVKGKHTISQVTNLQDILKKESCEKCKIILDKLFMNRLRALTDINKEIEVLFKLTSHKKNKEKP